MKTFKFQNRLNETKTAKIVEVLKSTVDYTDYRVQVGKALKLINIRIWSDGLKEVIRMY